MIAVVGRPLGMPKHHKNERLQQVICLNHLTNNTLAAR
jgi:hypothetical protein